MNLVVLFCSLSTLSILFAYMVSEGIPLPVLLYKEGGFFVLGGFFVRFVLSFFPSEFFQDVFFDFDCNLKIRYLDVVVSLFGWFLYLISPPPPPHTHTYLWACWICGLCLASIWGTSQPHCFKYIICSFPLVLVFPLHVCYTFCNCLTIITYSVLFPLFFSLLEREAQRFFAQLYPV